MPSFPCAWPTCSTGRYVARRGGYCPEHEAQGQRERSKRQRYYDQHLRDADAKRFYDSAAWKRARQTRLDHFPVCERCQRVFAQHVHHRIPLKRCTPAQRLDQAILMALCQVCHNIVEAETRQGR